MKAFKGCTNENCQAYEKIHYKKDDRFCSKCGCALSYVCADCWKVLETNENRLCISCEAKREQKKEQRDEKAKKFFAAAGGVAVAAVGAVKNADAIVDGAKKVLKGGAEIAKMIKK